MTESASIRMTLNVPSTGRVGEGIPVAVQLRNNSMHPVLMVGVLDGSEAGYRYPQYLPQITSMHKTFPPANVAECGIVAPLRIEDFRLLAIGESFDPTVPVGGASYVAISAFTEFYPPTPGRYEYRLTFSSESSNPDDWLGVLEYPGHEAVRAKLASVPRLRLTATASIQVVE